MEAAAVLFALAAAGGITMAVMLMRGAEQPPAWLSMLHGFLAAAGFTLLIEEAVTTGLPQLALLALGALALAPRAASISTSPSGRRASRCRLPSWAGMARWRCWASCCCWRQ